MVWLGLKALKEVPPGFLLAVKASKGVGGGVGLGVKALRAFAFAPTIQELLGHRDVATTMIYTHVLNRGPFGVRSPID